MEKKKTAKATLCTQHQTTKEQRQLEGVLFFICKKKCLQAAILLSSVDVCVI